MKVPPDHYKGVHTTSKGPPPCCCHHGENVNKPVNFNSAIMVTQSLIIHDLNQPDSHFGCPTLNTYTLEEWMIIARVKIKLWYFMSYLFSLDLSTVKGLLLIGSQDCFFLPTALLHDQRMYN